MNSRKEFQSNKSYYLSVLPKECANCGKTGELDIHHIVPLVKGGTNRISNFAVLCLECHGKIHGTNRVKNKELQKLGIKKAQKQGVKFGRPVATFPPKFEGVYKRWKDGKIKAIEAMGELDLKRTTFYKLVKGFEENITN
ncbi:TPA: HNH endonuclease [Bacillus cereus]|nr:HNH endonuclease [Bacillus cereus]